MTTRTERQAMAALLCLGLAWAAGCARKDDEAAVEPAVKEAGPPRIVVAEPSFDAGKVKRGENVEHVFKVRNEGESDLILDRARTS